MASQRVDEPFHEREGVRRTMKRRGILAAAGAVVAGVIAKQVAQPVAAGYSLQGDASNTATATTIIGPFSFLANTPILQIANGFTTGFPPLADAIQGAVIDNTSVAVRGLHDDSGDGLYGHSPHGVGVRGHTSDGLAVVGNGGSGVGVYGDTVGVSAPALYGIGYVTGSTGVTGRALGVNGIGINGQSNTSTGIGVMGSSTLGVGVYGLSSATYGVVGVTTAGAPYSGITGGANTAGAAYFTGPVVVDGSFTVVNPVNKHGAIKHPDGSHRHALQHGIARIMDRGLRRRATGRWEGGGDAGRGFCRHRQSERVHRHPGRGRGLQGTLRDE
jgi:hypothetical protein